MENTKYQIMRQGPHIFIQELCKLGYADDPNPTYEWNAVGSVLSIDKINGKKASEMTDAELIASYSPTSRNWSH